MLKYFYEEYMYFTIKFCRCCWYCILVGSFNFFNRRTTVSSSYFSIIFIVLLIMALNSLSVLNLPLNNQPTNQFILFTNYILQVHNSPDIPQIHPQLRQWRLLELTGSSVDFECDFLRPGWWQSNLTFFSYLNFMFDSRNSQHLCWTS